MVIRERARLDLLLGNWKGVTEVSVGEAFGTCDQCSISFKIVVVKTGWASENSELG